MSKRLILNVELPILGWDVTLKILHELALLYTKNMMSADYYITVRSHKIYVKNLASLCTVHSRVYENDEIRHLFILSKQFLYICDRMFVTGVKFRSNIGFIQQCEEAVRNYLREDRATNTYTVLTNDYPYEVYRRAKKFGYEIKVVTKY